MRKYWQFIKMSFQELAEYRMNLVWEVGGISIHNIFVYLFWVTALASGVSNPGYNAASLGIYYLLIVLVGQFTFFSFWDIANSIRDDFISAELAKPYSFAIKSFCITVAAKLIKVVIALLILMIIIWVSNFEITLFKSTIFFFGMIIASIARFFIGMSIGVLAFWFKRVHGFNALFWNIGGLFSGELIPVDLLPELMLKISAFLPFSYLTYFPVSLVIKDSDWFMIVKGFLVQILWTAIFGSVYFALWKKGIKKLEAAGG